MQGMGGYCLDLEAVRERIITAWSRHTCAPSEAAELVSAAMLWVNLVFLFCSRFFFFLGWAKDTFFIKGVLGMNAFF